MINEFIFLSPEGNSTFERFLKRCPNLADGSFGGFVIRNPN